MSAPTKDQLVAAAEHWEALARESEAKAEWDRRHGFDLGPRGGSAGDFQAATFRKTAQALRLEADTGRSHCTNCLGDHPNHLHSHRG